MKTTKKFDHTPTGRLRPKRRLGTVLRAKMNEYRSRVSEFEDDAPSSTAVRWLIVLLLVHLVLIGGVWMRKWFKNSTQTVEMTVLPAPPTVAQTPIPVAALPQAIPEPAPVQMTITQPEQVVDARPTPPASPAPPTAVEPENIPDAAPIAGPARHIVRTGDTWERIASANQVSVNDLKAVNPQTQRLVSGATLAIPARPGDVLVPDKTEASEPVRDCLEHVVQRGETLSRIAGKYKMNWRTLQKYNKMSDKDVARLKIGQKILIPKR